MHIQTAPETLCVVWHALFIVWQVLLIVWQAVLIVWQVLGGLGGLLLALGCPRLVGGASPAVSPVYGAAILGWNT